MEKLLRDNPLVIVSTAMMLVWFILTCIRVYFPKRGIYIAEMITLFMNIVGDIYLAYVAANRYETLEQCIIFAAWAIVSFCLLAVVFDEFYNSYCYERINYG